jgi:2-polyprenyl-3-methyl-5-hydroxy-6-metoxy-1,4-benzoquinol methylase
MYAGLIMEFLASSNRLEEALEDLADTVRRGGNAGAGSIGPNNPMWVTFARAMVPLIVPVANLLADHVAAWPEAPRRVLDIAAGHGMFGILLAQKVPGVEITAVDWAAVLEEARANAARMGVAERYRTVAGSAFEVDWGTGFDLILVPNFLHHFNHETCVALLRKVRESLTPDGRVLASEFAPNPDRVTPPMAARFMARDAGFRGVASKPLLPSPQTLVEFLR